MLEIAFVRPANMLLESHVGSLAVSMLRLVQSGYFVLFLCSNDKTLAPSRKKQTIFSEDAGHMSS